MGHFKICYPFWLPFLPHASRPHRSAPLLFTPLSTLISLSHSSHCIASSPLPHTHTPFSHPHIHTLPPTHTHTPTRRVWPSGFKFFHQGTGPLNKKKKLPSLQSLSSVKHISSNGECVTWLLNLCHSIQWHTIIFLNKFLYQSIIYVWY